MTGWPARGDALTLNDGLAGSWLAVTVRDPVMKFGVPEWSMQWKAYVPGWSKVNVFELPMLVVGGLPASHTSGWPPKSAAERRSDRRS